MRKKVIIIRPDEPVPQDVDWTKVSRVEIVDVPFGEGVPAFLAEALKHHVPLRHEKVEVMQAVSRLSL